MRLRETRPLRWAPAVGFIALLLGLALLPEPYKGLLATKGLLHVFAHVAAFSVAFYLSARPPLTKAKAGWLAVALLSFGAALELAQTAIYHNPLEWFDILFDALGIVLGLFLRRRSIA